MMRRANVRANLIKGSDQTHINLNHLTITKIIKEPVVKASWTDKEALVQMVAEVICNTHIVVITEITDIHLITLQKADLANMTKTSPPHTKKDTQKTIAVIKNPIKTSHIQKMVEIIMEILEI